MLAAVIRAAARSGRRTFAVTELKRLKTVVADSCWTHTSTTHFLDRSDDPLDRPTVDTACRLWTDRFRRRGVPDAEASTRILLADVLGSTDVSVVDREASTVLSAGQLQRMEHYGKLRSSRMPVQYIIQEWDFLDFTLRLRPPVFIPRPETEVLAQLASQALASKMQVTTDRPIQCLEIGCGSGALSLALLRLNPLLHLTAVDRNPEAVALTLENARRLRLEHRLVALNAELREDGFQPRIRAEWCGRFDVVVSNPPYVPTAEIEHLEPEVRSFEDNRALDGGPDGARVIRLILEHAPHLMRSDGILLLEMDPRQMELVRSIWPGRGFRRHCDNFGVERLAVLER